MGPRLARQLFLIGLASSLWSAIGAPTVLAWLGAYAVAWLACQLPPARNLIRNAPAMPLLVLAVVLAAPGVAFAYRSRAAIAQNEGLLGAVARFEDRSRLQALPAIAPPMLSIDRPQTFFVATSGARHLNVHIAGVRALRGEALGDGLFRVEYNPRRDGVPKTREERLSIELECDGRSSTRDIGLARPLPHPRWFCVAPDREHAVALSEETDELFVLTSQGIALRAPVQDGPVDCAFSDANHVVISHRHGRTLALFDIASGQIARSLLLPARLGRLAASPSGRLIAVSLASRKPEIAIVRVPELTLVSRVELDIAADWLAFGSDDGTLFAATRADASVQRFVSHDGKFEANGSLHLGRPAVTLARSRTGAQLWAATTDLHAAGHAQLGNHFVQDQLLTLDTAAFTVTAQHFTAQRSERQSKPGDVDRGGSPIGLHEARDGALWIAFAGTDEVWRLAADASAPKQWDVGDAGLHTPHGVAELADGTLLVSSPVSGAFGLISPGAREARAISVSAHDAWLLEHDRTNLARRIGERGFYETTRSGIACQSCHIHADSDDAAYNLGDHRLLPTLSVRGLANTAPYLRDATYPRLSDLDEVAQTLYRGYLRNQAARGATIEAFVSALPRRESLVTPEERDAAAERRGYAAFRKARCATCHAPPAFTNLAQLPLRFLFPEQAAKLETDEVVDTPSLLSVVASAPYLNDGRAPTLHAVLVTENSRNLHGDVKGLDARERRDLTTFLESL